MIPRASAPTSQVDDSKRQFAVAIEKAAKPRASEPEIARLFLTNDDPESAHGWLKLFLPAKWSWRAACG
jgi:hypothetical protein